MSEHILSLRSLRLKYKAQSTEPDLAELVTTLKIEPRRPRRKYLLWASWLSFLPDHALDSILDARDLPVN
jgi:hypothetical protein